MDKFFARRISAPILTLAVALLLASAGNLTFWSTLTRAAGGLSFQNLPLLVGAFLIIVLFFNACLTLASFRFVAKPVLIMLVLAAASASYFIAHYGIVIDTHTANGMAAAHRDKEPGVKQLVMSTAQACKFDDTIRQILGKVAPRPPEFEGIEKLPRYFVETPADINAVRKYIERVIPR